MSIVDYKGFPTEATEEDKKNDKLDIQTFPDTITPKGMEGALIKMGLL